MAVASTLDAAVWISRADGRYDEPANWLYNRVPGEENVLLPAGPGQPVVTVATENNSVLRLESHLPMRIEGRGELSAELGWFATAPLVISNASAFVQISAIFEKPVHLNGGQLQLSGPTSFKDLLTIDRGGLLALNGSGTTVDLSGGLQAVNFSVSVEDGAVIDLPQFVNYDGPGDFSGFLPAGTKFEAEDAGSRITLPELVTARGPETQTLRGVPTVLFETRNGGVIDAPKLEVLTGRAALNSTGNGSRINVPRLSTITGPESQFVSDVDLSNRGEITMAPTAVLTRCNVSLIAPSVLRGGMIEIATGSSLRGAGTIAASLLNRGLITLDRTPDALIIEGNLELSSASIVSITLGLGSARTDAGHFDLRSGAVLGGALRVTFPRAYTPAAGDQFTLATLVQPAAGSFSTIDDTTLGPLKVELLSTEQEIEIRLATRP
jgi:hypothetical protein